jgi:histidinol phosphatase-like PHP family hydrolase
MKVDLHVHASERSQCAQSGEEQMIQSAIACGLDGLAFTDHHNLVPLGRLEALNHTYAPFRVFGGVEITVDEGEDLLVLGVHHAALESRDWPYPALYDFVRERGGFLILAHPFRFRGTIGLDLERFPPDAIEVRSKNTPVDGEVRICRTAERFGIHLICNSDAHQAKHVGMYYSHLKREPQDERELLGILRAGQYACYDLETAEVIDYDVESRPQPCQV